MARGRQPEPQPLPASSDTAYIGQGTKIDGNCETAGRLRIEGHVTGNVRAGTLELAPGGRIDGDVDGAAADGDHVFVIEGRVAGAVRARRVQVGREGHVDGGVEASEAVVQGRVSGGVLARERLILEETGVVEGDVRAFRLALKEGGQVNGEIRMGERANE